MPAPGVRPAPGGWALVLAAGVWLAGRMVARAQEIEPRTYTKAPVGLNLLIPGYGYSDGRVAPDLPGRIPTIPAASPQ